MINGEGRVYEIKSDLDNFDRLHDQLNDYFKAFSKVSVLSTIHEYERVERILAEQGDMGESVGIYVVNDSNDWFNRKDRREPQQFDEELDHTCIFKLLRKREYENAVRKFFGEIPQATPVFHFRTYLDWFQKIPILDAQKLALAELKERNKITTTAFSQIQPELKSVVYFSNMTKRLNDIEQMLEQQYRG
ncbi:hypothetical protein FACS1894167_09710 [Synergistales bacterium]|nr:hypothetical protein FACS1894167_09710 [Synergistales bacterium]